MCIEAEFPAENQEPLTDHTTGKSESVQDTDSACCDSHTDKSEPDLSDDERQSTVNKRRACPVCKGIFNNPTEYTLHLKKHTRGTECLVCNKVLSSPNSLDRHLLVHSGEKPFSCQHCGKAFTTNGNMNRHKRKRKHQGSKHVSKKAKKMIASNEAPPPTQVPPVHTGRFHECRECLSGFYNALECAVASGKWDLIAGMDCAKRRTCPHKTDQSREPKQTDKVSTNQCRDCGGICLRMSYHGSSNEKECFICNVCERGFLSRHEFEVHKQNHKTLANHKTLDEINFGERKESHKNDFLKSVGLLRTVKRECVKANHYLEEKSMREAEYPVYTNQSYPVPDATSNLQVDGGNTTVDPKEVVSLNSEAIPNIGSPYSPDRASPNAVQGPTSPVDGCGTNNVCVTDNELQCKGCGEYFKTKKLLKLHNHEIHLLKSTFRCPECTYVSTDKSTLNRHTRIHTGERPYMCVNCSRTFTTETNAKRHVRKKHNIADKLKKHIMCITNDKSSNTNENTKCPYCKSDFGDSKILTQHKNSPECPGKPYICSECPMRFPTKNNCLRHMTHQHKMEKDRAKQTMIICKTDIQDESEIDQQQQKVEQILDAANDTAIAVTDTSSLTEEPDVDVLNLTNTDENLSKSMQLPMISETAQDFSVKERRDSQHLTTFDNSQHLNSTNVCQRPSSVEVDVSYSMLRLSEEVPYQKEQERPLDLSMRPIDLTINREIPKLELQQNSSVKSSKFLSQQPTPLPAHASSMSKYCSMKYPFLSHCYSSAAQVGRLGENYLLDNIRSLATSKIYEQPIITVPHHSFANESFDSDDYGQNLVIAEDITNASPSGENGSNQTMSVKPCTSDDLASVSSVIDTANSQDISKFLNPATFTKTSKAEFFISSTPKSHVLKNAVDNNSKRFPCPMCDSSFDTSSTLNRHLVTHTGEKKFKCSICSKGFGTKSNCKRHELTHSARGNQKPRTPQNESQNNSDASNTDSMEIDVSHSSLSRKFDVKHSSVFNLTTDFLSKNLECKFCKTSYRNKQDLTSHIKELHPLEHMSAGFH